MMNSRRLSQARRWPMAVAAVGLLLAAVAPTVTAVTPAQQTIPFHVVVEDPAACGFGVRWSISGVASVQTFFDGAGVPTFGLAHVQEHNVLTNLATGETADDHPVYEQVARFGPDGSLVSVDTLATWINAHDGSDRLMDVGRVSVAVLSDGSRVIVFAVGQTDFREATLTDLRSGLTLFCDLLS
jgi:hypothetical protein